MDTISKEEESYKMDNRRNNKNSGGEIEAKGKGEIEKYKKLNEEFQKKARYNKDIHLR